MRYTIDHDLHIHSHISLCSNIPEQNPVTILEYAKKNHLAHICLTDHFWDEKVPLTCPFDFYEVQNFEHISQALPLPQAEGVQFHFGCETDMDKHGRIGITPETLEKVEVVIVPTTHMHMNGFTIDPVDFSLERRAALYIQRFQALLDADLPAHKTGIAHLTCGLMAPDKHEDHLLLLDSLSDSVFEKLFDRAAKKGFGIELNMELSRYTEEELETILRPYRLAKKCGCTFYLGCDAHHPQDFVGAIDNFDRIITLLELEESDKFRPFSTEA